MRHHTTSLLSLALTLLALAALVALLATPVAASDAIAQKVALNCTACHDKPGSKLLTDEGKYYELMGNLDGFAQLEKTFRSCTACHVARPGSTKLTAEGRKFADLVKDMEGLRDYLAKQHPAKSESAP
jgi:cytochrome c2